jgi:hypothetical protein
MMDLTVTVTFEEPEARLLSQIVLRAIPDLPEANREVLASVARKFGEASEAKIAEIEREHGTPEAANAWAREYIAAHPEGDL